MINNKKIVVVMPAYNAEKTLEKTYNDLCQDVVDEIILIEKTRYYDFFAC